MAGEGKTRLLWPGEGANSGLNERSLHEPPTVSSVVIRGWDSLKSFTNRQASEHLLPNQDWTLCQNKCWSYICGNYLKHATVCVLNLFSLLAVMPTTTGYWFRTKVSLMPINMHLKKQLDLLVRCSYFCCNYMSEKQRLHFIIQSFTSANVYFCL